MACFCGDRKSQGEQRYAGQQLKDEYKALGDYNIQVHGFGLGAATSDEFWPFRSLMCRFSTYSNTVWSLNTP